MMVTISEVGKVKNNFNNMQIKMNIIYFLMIILG